jgi:hypothetical protein
VPESGILSQSDNNLRHNAYFRDSFLSYFADYKGYDVWPLSCYSKDMTNTSQSAKVARINSTWYGVKGYTKRDAELILLHAFQWLNLYSLPIDSQDWIDNRVAKNTIKEAMLRVAVEL